VTAYLVRCVNWQFANKSLFGPQSSLDLRHAFQKQISQLDIRVAIYINSAGATCGVRFPMIKQKTPRHLWLCRPKFCLLRSRDSRTRDAFSFSSPKRSCSVASNK
jgi:hypothetical protein